MAVPDAAAPAEPDGHTEPPSAERLLSVLPASPRIRVRPWWFPAQELSVPLVFHLEAWVADRIFGPDRAVIPEMEWMSQALLSVDTVNSGKLAEISVFGRPGVQNRVRSILLNLASWHLEQQVQRVRIKQLEEFLKFRASRPEAPSFLFNTTESSGAS
uniref:oocyte-expressed protein homolog n=1 Tax=Jaculus jaculus TaxID=51337 RepID=UPI001E1B4D97|nr:oocyte-expressed protein homolog [Jaculus jaculus]